MADVDISLVGAASLRRVFSNMEVKVQRKITRKVLRKAMKIILQAVKQRAPVDTGRLKKFMKVKAVKRQRKFIGIHIMMPERSKIGISGEDKYYYPAVIEYGSDKRKARPFMRPGFDQSHERAWKIIQSEMKKEIEAVIKATP